MATGEISAEVSVTAGVIGDVAAKAPPWYRHRWPWLLMAGPAIVVVAGIITTVIAFKTSDGLVADDYYKQGLTINRLLARDASARALGLAATARFGAGNNRVRIAFDAGEPGAEELRLVLLHPTRAGLDQTVALVRIAPGLWEAPLVPPAQGLWRVQLESTDGGWRIAGDWQSGRDSVQLLPTPAGTVAGAVP